MRQHHSSFTEYIHHTKTIMHYWIIWKDHVKKKRHILISHRVILWNIIFLVGWTNIWNNNFDILKPYKKQMNWMTFLFVLVMFCLSKMERVISLISHCEILLLILHISINLNIRFSDLRVEESLPIPRCNFLQLWHTFHGILYNLEYWKNHQLLNLYFLTKILLILMGRDWGFTSALSEAAH